MPAKVERIKWECPRCGAILWLRPCDIKGRAFCSRRCMYSQKKPRRKENYGERICEYCKKYYEAHSVPQRFCSQACVTLYAHSRRRTRNIAPRACAYCGKIFRPRQGSTGSFCSWDCKQKGQRGAHWTGGRYVDSHGYIRIWMPQHPNAIVWDTYLSIVSSWQSN